MSADSLAVTVRPDAVIGRIRPEIYGHFAEHLGRCIDEGVWVGERSKIPNHKGVRKDVAAALKKLAAPVVRWPGGCFADDYHWQDGVGPRSKRPRTLNLWWGQEESNEFGTDEFIDFCRLVGAEPYICCNVGSGSPAEARAWLEYCNYAGRTRYAQMRRRNGHAKPHGVRYWGVGNENWGCGGRFTARDYAKEYRRYACYLRGRPGVFGPVELIACGHTTPDWNHDFLHELGDPGLLDHLSIHRYYHAGDDVEFTDHEYYNALAQALAVEEDIQAAADVIDVFCRGRRFVGVVLDEWGMWHKQATVDTGLYQENTLRDALVAAVTFNVLNRWAHRVTMANIAQTVNVLQCVAQTRGAAMWLTPTYHAFALFKPHMGADAVEVEVDCPTLDARARGKPFALPQLSASASVRSDGRWLTVTLVNASLDADAEVRIRVRSHEAVRSVSAKVLWSEDMRDVNSARAKTRVAPKPLAAAAKGREIVVACPRHSLAAVTARRA